MPWTIGSRRLAARRESAAGQARRQLRIESASSQSVASQGGPGALAYRDAGQCLSWDIALGPGDGRLFVVRRDRLAGLSLTTPGQLARGAEAVFEVGISDQAQRPARGLLPLQVTVRDSQGPENDASDYYLAVDGKASVRLPVARNEPRGDWSVEVRELVGGNQAKAFFEVR
jgi:hypothetical protein